jgi:predicted nucleic acid-binding protein
MTKVFADTLYWVAITRRGDPWAEAAQRALSAFGEFEIVTTDEVLSEFLTAMSKGGPRVRSAAAEIVQRILSNPEVEVVPQSRASFLRALDRYAARLDKQYSLTDCASMNAMDNLTIRDALTNDHHFEQEGYNALIRK